MRPGYFFGLLDFPALPALADVDRSRVDLFDRAEAASRSTAETPEMREPPEGRVDVVGDLRRRPHDQRECRRPIVMKYAVVFGLGGSTATIRSFVLGSQRKRRIGDVFKTS